jgi:hypothetical protein
MLVRKLYQRLFPLPFLVIGLLAGFVGFRDLIDAHASHEWPQVPGMVTISDVVREPGHDGVVTYRADVRYVYVVDEVQYSSDRVSFGEFGLSGSARARHRADLYPKDSEVMVYYKSTKPGTSILEAGTNGAILFFPALGLIFSLVGAFLFWFLPREKRR